ncbi:PLDc N-terminal domain-containing protein [Loktanella agnita]|uniref:PLDc N-terminal domain-containing protein n=1 Tax=Loktanella agnita TaxID=287097 RepID=UPI003987000A
MPLAFISIIIVLCALYAILQVVTSAETTVNKTVWTLLIIVLPVIGFIIWVVAGPRTQKAA